MSNQFQRHLANLTSFTASAAIMLMEVAAGALISPHVGMSLYTWTAIIGVVMAGMAAGNALGGRIADRHRPARALAGLFLLAALGCAAIVPLNGLFGALPALAGLSWPVRILFHCLGTFFVPALLLGAISPVVARLALAHADGEEGRAVGAVFAWGVAGSILGTFVTGYWLVYAFGTREIVLSAAGVLALLGAGFFLAQRRGAAATGATMPRGAEIAADMVPLLLACATVFASNALFMTFELAAARVVTRNFGASLYTWTAVIGIMLAGITLGNYLGGRLADRGEPRRWLAPLLLSGSILCFLSPMLSRTMAMLLSDSPMLSTLPWPVQVSLHVAAAFLLPCVFIGTVSPLAIKHLLDEGHAPGSAVGAIYACGSAGAIAGTFATGYFLIDLLWSLPVIGLVTAALAALALCFAARPWGVAAWLAAAWTVMAGGLFLAAATRAPSLEPLARAAGLRAEQPMGLLYEDESQYSYIAVVEAGENGENRQFILDKLVHSEVNVEYPTRLQYEYEWIYDAIIDTRHPSPAPVSTLVIGGGGFAFPHFLELTRPGSYIETAEIDPAVTEAAHAAFGFPRETTVRVHNMDARNRIDDLRRAQAAGADVPRFDYILGDSINDYTVPRHLTTLEFAQDVHALLKDDGVYMLNLIDLLESARFVSAVVTTLREVFPAVYVFNTGSPPHIRDTFVVVCMKVPIELAHIPEKIREHYNYVGDEIPAGVLQAPSKKLLLTDNYAPVDLLLRPVVDTRVANRAEVLLGEAEDAAAIGEIDEALALCAQAAAAQPVFPSLYEFEAALRAQQGDTAGQIEALRKALVENPNPAATGLELARALIAAGQRDAAYEAFTQAVAAEPDFLPVRSAFATQALADGRADLALPHWQYVASRSPGDLNAHYNLGLAFAGLRRMEDAVAAWERALKIIPTHLDSLHNLALGLHMLQRNDEARAVAGRIRAAGGTPDPKLTEALGE